jgi:uncharacterized protein (TIGR02186 family)
MSLLARAIVIMVTFVAACLPVAAERLITSVSASRVLITSSYTGAELVLFGAIERDAVSISRAGPYDVLITVRGPASPLVVREKERMGPIWVNGSQMKFIDMPGYYAVLSSRPLTEVTSEPLRERFQIGLQQMVQARGGAVSLTPAETADFHQALIRLKSQTRLFQQNERDVVFLAPGLFRAAISLPATAPLGNYEAVVTLFADGAPLATEKSDFEVVKTGFEARMAMAAFSNPWLYGLLAVMIALAGGWLANYAFRRE